MQPVLPSLSRSLVIQGRVLYACMMREVITRFGRHNIGVLWLVAEPMIFTLGVAALWYALRLNHASDIPIIAFAVTGYSSVLGWRNAATRCSMAITANRALLFHRNVRVIDILLTRSILEIGGATASFFVLTAIFSTLGWMALPRDPLTAMLGWLMLAWFGIALGLLMGAGTAYSDLFEKLWTPAAYLLFPLSGAAFMVEWLPQGARPYILMFPMVHGVEMVRDGFFGHLVRTHYDVAYLATICLVMTLFALAMSRGAGRRVEQLMLRVADLTKRYRTRRGARTVLDGITFDLRKGENLGIVGRNGAGKSTLIRLLAGQKNRRPGESTAGCRFLGRWRSREHSSRI